MKTNYPILRQILFAAMPLVLLAGCSDKDDPAPIGVAGVEMSKPTLELSLDGTERLTATVTPDNAADKTLTWSSSDEAVATVSSEGVITAVRAGHATITAAAGGKTGTCALTVNPDIYVAGSVYDGNNNAAVVWKNGKKLCSLTDGKQNAYANSVFVSDGVVYTAGNDGKPVAKVWKDGTELHALTDGKQSAHAYSVFVSGGAVYTAGYEYNENGKSVAKVWKDGTVLHTLADGTLDSDASSVYVADGDVYVCGVEEVSENVYMLQVWKNGKVLHSYTPADQKEESYLNSISVWDGDVYTAGYEGSADGYPAKVWKNDGELYTLTEDGYASSVFVYTGPER